jgi:hypothetical protein
MLDVVAFVEAHDAENEIDEAYQSKYGGRYPDAYGGPDGQRPVRATTLRLE